METTITSERMDKVRDLIARANKAKDCLAAMRRGEERALVWLKRGDTARAAAEMERVATWADSLDQITA